jgi:hypothetical protein
MASLSLSDWATVVGFPVAIVAAVFAGLQLRVASQQSKAAETAPLASQRAVERTERHLADNHLLLWVPKLEQVARNLEAAARSDRRDATMVHLTEWRETATHVRTLVERDGDRPELIAKLQTAVAMILSAKDDLVADSSTPAAEATRHVRTAINEACDKASEIVAERMAYPRRDER